MSPCVCSGLPQTDAYSRIAVRAGLEWKLNRLESVVRTRKAYTTPPQVRPCQLCLNCDAQAGWRPAARDR
jgi:hypothetical protein